MVPALTPQVFLSLASWCPNTAFLEQGIKAIPREQWCGFDFLPKERSLFPMAHTIRVPDSYARLLQ